MEDLGSGRLSKPAKKSSRDVNTLTLYAMWKKYEGMQGFNCSSLSINQEESLPDSRDGNTYRIKKMGDGKCWMMENLRLGSNDHSMSLTPEDTNITSNFTLPRGVSSNGPNIAIHMDLSSYNTGYYSWYAAVAGGDASSGEVSSSICPKNWRLPTGGNISTEFGIMASQFGSSGNQQAWTNQMQSSSGFNINFPGLWGNGSPGSNGSQIELWSRSVKDNTNAHSLYIYSTGVDVDHTSGKTEMWEVRCVADS